MTSADPTPLPTDEPVQVFSLPQRRGRLEFLGVLLAEVSTRADEHVELVHPPGRHAAPGDRCSACRWSEVRVYRVTAAVGVCGDCRAAEATRTDPRSPDPRPSFGWVVETVGGSSVPGETARTRAVHVHEPRRVVSTLVQQRTDRNGDVLDAFIPTFARRALDEAADEDPALADAVDTLVVFD